MMRTSSLWQVLFLALLACSASVSAQTPSAAPPKLDKIEEVADDPITVNAKPAPEHKITDKRDDTGVITETTVKSGPSTYTVRATPPIGTAMPGDAMNHGTRGAQWTIMEFDLGKKKKTQKEDETADDGTAPPPPPVTK